MSREFKDNSNWRCVLKETTEEWVWRVEEERVWGPGLRAQSTERQGDKEEPAKETEVGGKRVGSSEAVFTTQPSVVLQ